DDDEHDDPEDRLEPCPVGRDRLHNYECFFDHKSSPPDYNSLSSFFGVTFPTTSFAPFSTVFPAFVAPSLIVPPAWTAPSFTVAPAFTAPLAIVSVQVTFRTSVMVSPSATPRVAISSGESMMCDLSTIVSTYPLTPT